MRKKKGLFLMGLVLMMGMCSCVAEKKIEKEKAKEFVPGIKRWAGPYKRIAGASSLPEDTLARPDVTLTIEAYTSEYKPKVIRVKQNQTVKLILKGTDDGDLPKITGLKEFSGHGFLVLGPYDIWVTGLRAGVTKEVIFKATVAGEFDYECTVFCGLKHYLMRGKLIVEPA